MTKKLQEKYDYNEEIQKFESFLNTNEEKYHIEILDKNYSDRVTMRLRATNELEERLNEMNKLIVIKM